MMRVLILGAGTGEGRPEAAREAAIWPPDSVWLAESGGRLLVQRLVAACAGLRARLVFAVRAGDMSRWHVDSVIALAAPDAVVVPIRGETKGAACTALLCLGHLDGDDELLVLNANEFLDIDYTAAIEGFRARGLDGGVVVFPSLHPRYSSVRLDAQGLIVEAAEKRPISRHAVAGFIWFKRAACFVTAAQTMIRKDAHVDGLFFMSLVLNEMVLAQARLGVLEVDRNAYHPLKSRRQIAQYEAMRDEATSDEALT